MKEFQETTLVLEDLNSRWEKTCLDLERVEATIEV